MLSLKGEASGAIGQNEQQADNVRAIASLDQQSDSTHTSGAVPRVRSPPPPASAQDGRSRQSEHAGSGEHRDIQRQWNWDAEPL